MGMRLERLLSAILSLALVLGLVPGTGLTAYAAVDDGLYVNDVYANTTTSGTGWSYDTASNTLTLENYTFEGKGYAPPTDSTVIMYYPREGTFTIELKGNNKIVQGDGTNRTWWGIYCRSDLVITGDGTLDIRTTDGGYRGAAIYGEKNITIEGNCTINASSGTVTNGPQGHGIGGDGNHALTIGADATVTLDGPYGGANYTINDLSAVIASVTVGDTTAEYGMFADALAAWADGGTLKLLGDVTTESTISVPTGTRTLDLNGHGVKLNGTGSVITVPSGATLTLDDSDPDTTHGYTVANPKPNGAGLATVDDENGTVAFTGGYITGGKQVSGNNDWLCGGALRVEGTLDFRGGTLIGNSAYAGAGIYVANGGSASMSGGAAIVGNYMYGEYWTGAGVAVGAENGDPSSASFTMSGGTISNNDSRINENWPDHAGGIGTLTTGTVVLTGGTISGNFGVGLRGAATVSGDVVIAGNLNTSNTAVNYWPDGGRLVIDGALGENASIGVTVAKFNYSGRRLDLEPGAFTDSEFTTYNDASKFFSDNEGYVVGKNADGQLFLGAPVAVTFDANGHGTAPEAQTVASGSVVSKPEDPAEDGWEFGGWYREDACTNAWNFDTDTVSEATTLYAKWEPRQEVAVVSTANLTLGGEIGLNFYLSVPESLAEGAKAAMDGPMGEMEVELASAKEEDGRYKVSYPVSAIKADKKINLKLLGADGGQIDLHNSRGEKLDEGVATYSVYGYLQAALADGSGLSDAQKAQVRATYTYCAYAARWKYGTELPEGINALPDEGYVRESARKAEQSGTAPDGVKVTGITLLLDSDTSLRLYFTCEGAVPGVTLDGAPVTPVQLPGTSKYYVEAGPIGVSRLDRQYSVRFGDEYEVQVCALSYVRSVLRSAGSSQELKDVCRALWAYGEAFATE